MINIEDLIIGECYVFTGLNAEYQRWLVPGILHEIKNDKTVVFRIASRAPGFKDRTMLFSCWAEDIVFKLTPMSKVLYE